MPDIAGDDSAIMFHGCGSKQNVRTGISASDAPDAPAASGAAVFHADFCINPLAKAVAGGVSCHEPHDHSGDSACSGSYSCSQGSAGPGSTEQISAPAAAPAEAPELSPA